MMKIPDSKIVAATFSLSIALFVCIAQASPGNVDPSFDPGGGPNADVYAVAVQPDGKGLIGGAFTSVNGTNRSRIARLNYDGSLDATFDPAAGANDLVTSIGPGTNGQVFIGGAFTSFNGVYSRGIARLNADGSRDDTFNPGEVPNNDVYSLAVQSDGKVILAGRFSQVYRLNADGSLDTTFDSGSGANSVINAVAIQSDGKVLVGGSFSFFNGVARSRIARLNGDGSLDESFFPGTGPNAEVDCITAQPDGKALIGGAFARYNETSRNHLARLNEDGSPDGGFYPAGGADGSILSIALPPDGKVLIGGAFTSYQGIPRGRIARLNATGSLDMSFDPGMGANALIHAVAEYPNGAVLIGGNFITVKGTSRPYVARLLGDSGPRLMISLSGPNVVLCWPTNAPGYTLQSTADLNPPVAWMSSAILPSMVGTNYIVTNALSGAAQFYRLKK